MREKKGRFLREEEEKKKNHRRVSSFSFVVLRFLNESSIAFAAICVACIIDGLEAFLSLLSLCRHHSG